MRKKLFAIVMSMTMVASFMPSLAFAATEHSYLAVDSFTVNAKGEAVAKDVANQAKVDKYVEVVKAPTHTEKGVVKIKCSTPLCDAVGTFETATIEHQKDTECAKKDFTIDQYAEQLHAQYDIPGTHLRNGDFETEADAVKWAKDMKAASAGYCYIKDVSVCSCGLIMSYGDWATHKNTKCTDEVCADCGATLKGIKHSPKAPESEAELKALKKVSEPTCGHGTGYEVECKNGCGIKTVWYHDVKVGTMESDKKDDAHNYGTKVAASTALKKVQGGYELKSGYVALNSTTDEEVADLTGITSEGKVGLVQCDFYQYNDVETAPTCDRAGTGALVCTVCGDEVVDDVIIPATGHDWEKTDVAATCDSDAYTHKVCKVCKVVSDVYKADTKLAHNYKVTMTNATCKGGEVYTVECTTCKDCADTSEELTKADFGPVDLYVEDTDTVTYLWKGFDNKLSTKDAIQLTFSKKPVAHKYGKKELLRAADCENDEVWGYKCAECGKIAIHGAGTYALDEKKNTALGHDHPVVEVAATCVNKAYKAKAEECTRCGKTDPEIVDDNKDLAKKAAINGGKHTFDKWVVTKKATVFEKGVESLVCSVCGADGESRTAIEKAKYAAPAVKAGKKSATVTVKATTDAVSYKVSYKKAGGSYKTVAAKAGKKTIKKLAKGKKYTFKVIAVNAEGVEVASATKTVKVK